MDSRDKEFTDLFEDNTKLKSIIQEKDKQISAMETNIFALQKKEAGIDATREALAGERDLVILLNKRIEAQKSQIAGLTELNQELTAMNLKLQRPGAAKAPVLTPDVSKPAGWEDEETVNPD